MSHSSGIPVSSDLNAAFTAARDEAANDKRFLKVQIVNDEMVLTASHPLSGNIQQDFDQLANYINDNEACYFLFRLDTKNKLGYEWVLIAFVPDTCKTKVKMIYASSLDNAKKLLGYGYFAGDIHVTLKSELVYSTLEHWHREVSSADASAAMTETEKQIKQELSGEVHTGVSTKNVHGVRFPIEDAATAALQKLAQGQLKFVSLKIDNETLVLDKSDANATVADLKNYLPPNEPRFVFFIFSHSHEGQNLNTKIFIYCAPENSKIKSKMVYSTTKSTVIEYAKAAGFETDRSLEITDLADLNESYLYSDLHPVVEIKKTFSKPARPGKGGARLVKKD